MKKYLITLLLIVFIVPIISFAESTAYTDAIGITHFSDGTTSSTDIIGNTHFSNGVTSYTDAIGTTHYSGGLNGGSGTSYTDAIGTTHFTFSDGTTVTAYTDAIGNTHYNDNKGNSGTAYTDAIGNTHYSGSIFSANVSTGSTSTSISNNTTNTSNTSSKHICTQAEASQLEQKYNIVELSNKMNSISNEMKSLPDIYSSTDMSLIRQTAIKSVEIGGRYNIAKGEYDNAWNKYTQECYAMGEQAYYNTLADATRKQAELIYKTQQTPSENLCVSQGVLNSHQEGNYCICDSGFFQSSKNKCVVLAEFCVDALGAGGIPAGTENCGCKTGYTLNTPQKRCELDNIIIPKKDIGNLGTESKKTQLITSVKPKPILTKIETQVKEEIKTPVVEPKAEVAPQVTSEPVKKLRWYQKIFNWLFK